MRESERERQRERESRECKIQNNILLPLAKSMKSASPFSKKQRNLSNFIYYFFSLLNLYLNVRRTILSEKIND